MVISNMIFLAHEKADRHLNFAISLFERSPLEKSYLSSLWSNFACIAEKDPGKVMDIIEPKPSTSEYIQRWGNYSSYYSFLSNMKEWVQKSCGISTLLLTF